MNTRLRHALMACWPMVLLALVLLPTVAHAATVRCEQADAEFATAGTWSVWGNAALSGGSYLYTNASGSSATVTFEGTKGVLIARQGPEFGAGEVFVDGVSQGYVCLYSPSTLYRQAVYTTAVLPAGRHTLTFAWTGRKNPASSNTYINIDAFDVEQVTAPPIAGATRIEQLDSHLLSLGGWSTWTNGSLSGGSYAFTKNVGGLTSLSFEGTRLDLVARTGPEFGYAKLTLDGAVQYVDLYSATTQYQVPVYSTWNLPSGPHTVRIEWSGRKNPAASGTYVNVDAFDIVGSVVQATRRYEQTDAPFCKADTWAVWSNPAFSGGSYAYTDLPGAQTCILYEGSEIDLICRTGPQFGVMLVSLDGADPTPVDLYTADERFQQTVYTAAPGPGLHALMISWTGEKNPSATGSAINVDAADIMAHQAPAITGASQVEQTDARLNASGAWSSWASPALSGGSYAYSATPGAQITTIFYGTRLDLYARTGPEFGYAKVTLDGMPRYVDLYSATTLYQQRVFSTWDRNLAVHVVRIEWCGRKNPVSSGTYVNLDRLEMKGSFAAAPVRHEQTSGSVAMAGAWSNWNNAQLSGSSYAYANTSGAEASFTVSDAAAVTLIARTGPEFGIARVRIDGGSALDVDLFSPTPLYRQKVATLRITTPGTHTVTVTWSGWRDPAATNTYINVDAFDATPMP